MKLPSLQKQMMRHTLLFFMIWLSSINGELSLFPYGVGGRFSVLLRSDSLQLLLWALISEGFLAGAASMDMACQEEDVYKNPALFSALLKYIASERYGRIIRGIHAYGESLHSLSDWYVQLLSNH